MFQIMQHGQSGTPGTISWFGGERTIDEFLQIMVDEQRLIYEFAVSRSYGMYGDQPG